MMKQINHFSRREPRDQTSRRLGLISLLSALGWISAILAFPNCGWSQAVDSDLPAESALPETRNGLEIGDDAPSAALPSEAMLPSALTPLIGQSPTGQTPPTDPASSPVALPSESVLQRGSDQPVASEEKPQDFQADTPGDQRPILRLNYPGHSGRIRALAMTKDGQRLISAGEDKDVHVWRRDPRNPTRWAHQRMVRWQVWRGPRGWIYDLATFENQIAIAGYGAMGGTGEVWIVNAETGKLIRPLADYSRLHRQAVDSIAWSNEASARLVSADLLGRVVVWHPDPETAKWRGTNLVDEDHQSLGPEQAQQLQPFRRFHPVAFYGKQIAHLTLQRIQKGAVEFPVWKVSLLDASAKQPPIALPAEIPGVVTELDSSSDGKILVAACYSAGEVKLWRRNNAAEPPSVVTIPVGGRPLFVELDRRGERLMVGTESGTTVSPTGDQIVLQPEVQIYDLTRSNVGSPQVIKLQQTASAGVFDPDGKHVVLAIGNSLRVHPTDGRDDVSNAPVQVLVAPIRGITRVAASKSAAPIEVAISRDVAIDGVKPFREVFDLSGLSINTLPNPKYADDDFLSPQRLTETWTVRGSSDDPNRFDVYRGEVRFGSLPLIAEKHGRPTTISTLKTSAGTPLVIVGTEGQNNIYIFPAQPHEAEEQHEVGEPQEAGQPVVEEGAKVLKVLRQFRGHAGAVRSMSATAEGRFLLSGGDDATLCVWNLNGVDSVDDAINRWGATFDLVDGRLLVDTIEEAGPLYFRGVRRGDHLAQIRWPDPDGKDNETRDNPTILKTLDEVAFDTQVVFEFVRQGRPIGTFQMFPAWYPLATVMMDEEREWAMWTPTGIYNASIAGNQRFGWQLNRGLSQDVEFFRADQFKANLERPAVMRRLLSRGSLAAAMRDTVGGAPPPGESSIVNQIESRPRIEIISPAHDTVASDETLDVVARIQTPPGVSLAGAKAFIDGIPGVRQIQHAAVESRPAPPTEFIGDVTEVHWKFTLPRQTRMQLQVIAATSSQSAATASIEIRREPDSFQPLGTTPEKIEPDKQPQMHLIAIGVGQYGDPNITSLDFPERATSALATTLRDRASGMYQFTSTQLVNREATRPLWRIYAESALERLRQTVSPDDLVIMYLCGHGTRDRRTGRWYFVTADANLRDLMNDQYEDCLSLSDLSAFAELPCRKLAILDSCHSGAVQSFLREDDLKAAIRFLQDDVVMTFTASEGQEEAAEVVESGLGRFTSRLIEAIRGQADTNGDGKVMLREIVSYVSQTVVADSAREGMSQHPTAGPRDLIDRLDLPISRASMKAAAIAP